MCVKIKMKHPEQLFPAIENGIKIKKIKSWEIDEDGHITHTPNKFYKKAWFSASVDQNNNEVVFKYIRQKNAKEDKALYGMYHGRLLKMIMSNFYKKFEVLSTVIE